MITMSEREVGRLRVLEQLNAGGLTQLEAATILKLSARQVRRLQHRLHAEGGAGLAHKLRGRASNRKLDAALALQVQQLLIAHYPDFGPTFAAQKLQESHGIVISVESVRKADEPGRAMAAQTQTTGTDTRHTHPTAMPRRTRSDRRFPARLV